jgi:hypothetical protein
MRVPMSRIPMTEYLEIDLDTERWLCRYCPGCGTQIEYIQAKVQELR